MENVTEKLEFYHRKQSSLEFATIKLFKFVQKQ